MIARSDPYRALLEAATLSADARRALAAGATEQGAELRRVAATRFADAADDCRARYRVVSPSMILVHMIAITMCRAAGLEERAAALVAECRRCPWWPQLEAYLGLLARTDDVGGY
ncbi:MAG: hypothetical protein MUE41_03730 [Gemmatimonadaceae bacterium]|jgi:hypothetical protein|nr:hypothetical protein [Gemmatimonadaceae bacterium]